ncbi:hypothetical protein EVAR_5249_1 [Eumeta japonica]|uniref:Uncharacterized protein n=1 Tax=Eumeta variegata TaxID=151549 RepID=A0A4C1XPX4_EUMVA|nr:hypothetical protein EVAR_5249_1 [Eumeta japonica]
MPILFCFFQNTIDFIRNSSTRARFIINIKITGLKTLEPVLCYTYRHCFRRTGEKSEELHRSLDPYRRRRPSQTPSEAADGGAARGFLNAAECVARALRVFTEN